MIEFPLIPPGTDVWIFSWLEIKYVSKLNFDFCYFPTLSLTWTALFPSVWFWLEVLYSSFVWLQIKLLFCCSLTLNWTPLFLYWLLLNSHFSVIWFWLVFLYFSTVWLHLLINDLFVSTPTPPSYYWFRVLCFSIAWFQLFK